MGRVQTCALAREQQQEQEKPDGASDGSRCVVAWGKLERVQRKQVLQIVVLPREREGGTSGGMPTRQNQDWGLNNLLVLKGTC